MTNTLTKITLTALLSTFIFAKADSQYAISINDLKPKDFLYFYAFNAKTCKLTATENSMLPFTDLDPIFSNLSYKKLYPNATAEQAEGFTFFNTGEGTAFALFNSLQACEKYKALNTAQH